MSDPRNRPEEPLWNVGVYMTEDGKVERRVTFPHDLQPPMTEKDARRRLDEYCAPTESVRPSQPAPKDDILRTFDKGSLYAILCGVSVGLAIACFFLHR